MGEDLLVWLWSSSNVLLESYDGNMLASGSGVTCSWTATLVTAQGNAFDLIQVQ